MNILFMIILWIVSEYLVSCVGSNFLDATITDSWVIHTYDKGINFIIIIDEESGLIVLLLLKFELLSLLSLVGGQGLYFEGRGVDSHG